MKRDIRQRFVLIFLTFVVMAGMGCSKGPSDEEISAAIKARYYADSEVKPESIEITVKDGEVTLSGQVSSDAARLQAYKLAGATPGVSKVNDQLTSGLVAEAPAVEPKPQDVLKPRSARPTEAAPQAAVEKPTPPREVTIPAGTSVRIQMIDSVNSKDSPVGATFAASLDSPIVVDNQVVVSKGADVLVRLVSSKSAGKIKGSSELELQLAELQAHGKSYPLTSSTYREVGDSRGKQSAKRIGIGAGIGTAIGAIAGGGKGAAIGAGIGAGSATAVQLMTRGKQVQVPSETKLDFELAEPVSVTLPPAKKK